MERAGVALAQPLELGRADRGVFVGKVRAEPLPGQGQARRRQRKLKRGKVGEGPDPSLVVVASESMQNLAARNNTPGAHFAPVRPL